MRIHRGSEWLSTCFEVDYKFVTFKTMQICNRFIHQINFHFFVQKMFRFIDSFLTIAIIIKSMIILTRNICIAKSSIPILNITEMNTAQTGNDQLPKWVDSLDREEFFNSVHNVPITEQRIFQLRDKWLEQG